MNCWVNVKREITEIAPWEPGYVFFFPTFLCGPVFAYKDFVSWMKVTSLSHRRFSSCLLTGSSCAAAYPCSSALRARTQLLRRWGTRSSRLVGRCRDHAHWLGFTVIIGLSCRVPPVNGVSCRCDRLTRLPPRVSLGHAMCAHMCEYHALALPACTFSSLEPA